ncbi:MAG TPA: FHA domain-containing protein [Micromonosporaceae bacterium]|jgi:hypothetical protein
MPAVRPGRSAEARPGAARWVAIDPAGTVLGRDAACELIVASRQVSRRHAMVSLRGGDYFVEDLGSRNGTTVNGLRVVGAVPLRDGDRLGLADGEVEFRIDEQQGWLRAVRTDVPWWPDAETAGTRPVEPSDDRPPSLRKQLHDAPGFSGRALLLAVAGSVVGTVLSGFTGTDQWGRLAGAALVPIVAATFSTKRAGDAGRVRTVAIVVLSTAALAITWAGVSVADLAAGRSVVPGAASRTTTFPGLSLDPPESDPGPTTGPALVVTGAVDCGSVFIGTRQACDARVTIRSTGNRPLRISRVEVTGPNDADFTVGVECVNRSLDTDETCAMTVRFSPSAVGRREATLVIHQNLPPPDRGTAVAVAGIGRASLAPCMAGFVWREAVADDHVCVTPETHAQVQADNALADTRRSRDGGPFGPDTCVDGFVWREAVPNDHVCVTPATREATRQDNALTDTRREHG